MKRITLVIMLVLLVLFSCTLQNQKQTTTTNNVTISTTTGTISTTTKATTTTTEVEKIELPDFIIEEERLSFLFFWEQANTDINSPGYGLIRDRYPGNPNLVSIASVGFGLTAIPIGIKNNWITYEEGYERALGTLRTIDNMEKTHGFYYHFVNINTGLRSGSSEVSVIDTAIMMNGVLFVGKYFGGEVEQLANKLYEEVEWTWYTNQATQKFYMGYKPETGFSGSWNGYAEQLMMYVLGAGSPTYPTSKALYNMMKLSSTKKGYLDVNTGEYLVQPFYNAGSGSLFTYQYSHAWIDFRNIVDEQGVDWFENSVRATKAAILYAIDMSTKYKSLHKNSWGLTACDGPNGYFGYGSAPRNYDRKVDGTVGISGAAGSIVFTPEESIRAMEHYRTFPELWGTYGFKDSYNLGTTENHVDESIEGLIPEGGWFARDVIGIDKGITLLMIENYRSDFVWDIYMQIKYVQDGLAKLGFREK